ncbi:MAG TPA: porin family protein, partial [Bacteroidales bacterium]|nr:porin family protein [Bacteroidales bacterium]
MTRYIIIILVSLAILYSGEGFAQKRGVMNLPTYDNAPYHFGFILALNQMDFVIKMKDGFQNVTYDSLQSPDIYADSLRLLSANTVSTLGFTVGIVGNLRMSRYFDLRFVPSLAFGERYIDYRMKAYIQGDPLLVEIRKNITSAHVDFPLTIRYRSKRVHNFGAYVFAGANYALDLAATRADKKEKENETLVKLRKNDVAALVGVGVEFYNAWFKLGIEVKMSYGLFNLLREEGNIYTGGIEELRSKIWQLSFTF